MPSLRSEKRHAISQALRRLPRARVVAGLQGGVTAVDVQDLQPLLIQNCHDCEIQARAVLVLLAVLVLVCVCLCC